MANMFTSYENNQIKNIPCEPFFPQEPKKGTKLITNVMGKVLGVQVEQANPLQLYFHLENLVELNTEEAWVELLQGTTVFEILTTTDKSVLSKEYQTVEILDQYTNDLYIALPREEMKKLKKETYAMKVILKTATTEYEVFAKKDGYLIVR